MHHETAQMSLRMLAVNLSLLTLYMHTRSACPLELATSTKSKQHGRQVKAPRLEMLCHPFLILWRTVLVSSQQDCRPASTTLVG